MVVVTAFMATVTFVQAEAQAWRDRVVAAVRPGAVVARRGLADDPITQAVLFGQGLQHRGLHDPLQPGQSPHVACQQVVLDDAPVLGSIAGDDRVVVVVDQPGAFCGFAALDERGGEDLVADQR